MALHKIYINKNNKATEGFSLIEILIVLALMSMLLASTLFFASDSYQRTAFLSERDTLMVTLQTARANALNNINQKSHGVALHPSGYDGYVLFQGTDFVHSDVSSRIEVPASYRVTMSTSSPQEVIFTQLSGSANYQGEIELIDSNRLATTGILLNYEGAIRR